MVARARVAGGDARGGAVVAVAVAAAARKFPDPGVVGLQLVTAIAAAVSIIRRAAQVTVLAPLPDLEERDHGEEGGDDERQP